MGKHLVISASLNPTSRSRVLARHLFRHLQEFGVEAEFIDLRDYPLPLCDASSCYGDRNVLRLNEVIRESAGILLAAPIYNFDVNAAAKNLIELTGRSWEHKVVGFACAAGGGLSYMSVMSVANSLMLDFRCVVLPRFVFTTGKAFDEDGQLVDEDVQQRLHELAATFLHVSTKLAEPSRFWGQSE